MVAGSAARTAQANGATTHPASAQSAHRMAQRTGLAASIVRSPEIEGFSCQPRPRLSRAPGRAAPSWDGRLLVWMQVDEALAQPAAVVAGRDPDEPGRVPRRNDRRLCRVAERPEVTPVDHDLHHRADALGEPGSLPETLPQRRAEAFMGAGHGESVSTPRLRAAARDAAGERHDDPWHAPDRGDAPLCRGERRADVLAQVPHVAAHQPLAIAEAPVHHELAAQDRDDPHAAPMPTVAELEAVAEVRDLAPELEVGLGLEQAEAGGGRTRHHVLADADEQRALEGLDAVLAKAWDVQLDDRPRAAVRRRERFVGSRADVAVEPGLAVAQDRGGRVAGGRLDRMANPGAVARRDQDLRMEALERLRVSVVNGGAAHRGLRPRP